MLKSIPDGVPVIIVDNGSKDAEKIVKIARRCNARLILNQVNLGFGQACNLGAAEADTELVLFINPDAVICDGALEGLAAAAENHSEASAFNPVIEYPDGRHFLRESSRISPRGIRYRRGLPDHDMEMPVLSGAVLLVRKEDFDSVNGFDPNIFLYHEDDDLCLRLQAQCGPLMFVRNARVVHDLGKSSGTDIQLLRTKGWHLGYSYVYAALKHGKPMAFERELYRAFRRTLSLTRMVNEQQRVERIGYLQGVLRAHHYNPSPLSRFRKWLSSVHASRH